MMHPIKRKVVIRILQALGWGYDDARKIVEVGESGSNDHGFLGTELYSFDKAYTCADMVISMIAGTLDLDVLEAIEDEREYQRMKWGEDKQQSLPGYLLIMRNELNEADLGWAKNLGGRSSALHEIRQVVATGVAAMEQYGTHGSAIATNDIRMK